MDAGAANLLGQLDAALAEARRRLPPARAADADELRRQVAAVAYHASRSAGDRPVVVLLGGTGTGKSTLLNRLLERPAGGEVAASSFRRTFTRGPVLVARDPADVPEGWPGLPLPPEPAEQLPAKGQPDRLTVAGVEAPLLAGGMRLVDTPDLDGDTPEHHAAADRCFRWADAAVWVVTPEKYQMKELLPYYQLARRWSLPSLAVMNKADDAETVADWRRQLADGLGAPAFVVPRDDSAYRPDDDAGLDALRAAVAELRPDPAGLPRRLADLAGRLSDQLVAPLRRDAAEAERVARAVEALAPASPDLDVTPMTKLVQKRLRDKSVLYLVGPGRIIDRVRSLPGVLARLPRTAIDFFRDEADERPPEPPRVPEPPDFPRITREAMLGLQGRVADVLDAGELPAEDKRWRLDPKRAGDIAEEELADFRRWLEERWDATPRDTALLAKLPGGDKLAKATEAAPYLLTAYLATSGALFGHLDLIALGTYGAATALMERLSNEVINRTRQTNKAITKRYDALAREQIAAAAAWARRQALPSAELKAIDRLVGLIAEKGARDG